MEGAVGSAVCPQDNTWGALIADTWEGDLASKQGLCTCQEEVMLGGGTLNAMTGVLIKKWKYDTQWLGGSVS